VVCYRYESCWRIFDGGWWHISLMKQLFLTLRMQSEP